MNPKARKKSLVTSKVGDETVVYDTKSNKASCLNELMTAVWEACDGNTDVSSIIDTVRNAGYQDTTEQLVLMAIEELDQAGLLEEAFEVDEKMRKRPNRREMLRVLSKRAAILLPVVSTINVQPAIAAATGNCLGDPCITHYPGGCCLSARKCHRLPGESIKTCVP